jgi:hypothetical protein
MIIIQRDCERYLDTTQWRVQWFLIVVGDDENDEIILKLFIHYIL